MENIKFDTWVKDRINFSDDDKQKCIRITNDIMDIAVEVRRNGILSLYGKIQEAGDWSVYKDKFVRKALTLAIDSASADELKKIMQDEIMEKDSKGTELLKYILIVEGVAGIIDGNSMLKIAVDLVPYFGENYFID